METDTIPTLNGKTYVITGATSGIGYAVAASLCARGASVIGVGRSYTWFPSVDYCEWDPDWIDCNNQQSAGACLNAGEVNRLPSWYEHVLSEHYPRSISFIGNACRDGKQDWGETGIDSGGVCP